MLLTVNGEEHVHAGDGTVAALLAELGAPPEHTAAVVNGKLIHSSRRESFNLSASDRIEVLTFVGGG